MSAVTTIPSYFTTEFDTNWQQLVQQKLAKVREYVMVDTVKGKEKVYNQLGPLEMSRITERAGETRVTDSPTGKRWLRPYEAWSSLAQV